MSLEQSQGIQALLAAEKAAGETIAKARKKKQQRLKQAQEEAEAEVARYKQEREAQFQAYLSTQAGAEEASAKLGTQTAADLKLIESQVAANKEAVIEALLEAVVDVKPRLHANFGL
eukprot:comp8831_c0_seq1/m.4039 comp8831_c0_seq1/g.4039  ORF comp8831_c0_seq1/g.4039 comp8831_c0_seq1/m.4039 type:complete len:117 (-) comp8831_c0_seq1:345-695(-)